MSGTFSQTEKVNFAVKSLLQLTTKYGSLPASNEAVALPRIFPVSIRKDDIITNGVGDLVDQVVDVTDPFKKVQDYKIIDPSANKVSNITVGNILTDNGKSGNGTFQILGNNTWSPYAYYSHWYASKTESSYPTDGGDISTYNGIRIAYGKTAINTEPTDDDIVPHIALYLHLPLTNLEAGGMVKDEGDTIAFYRRDQLTRNMLGPEVGFDIKLLANGATTYAKSADGISQSGIISKDDVINNSTFGSITLFSNLSEKYGSGSLTPYLSFCRYIGESGFGGGGSSVTVGEVNAVDPGLKQTGDLYYVKTSDTTGTLKINNGTNAWVDVGGGGGISYDANGNVGIGTDWPTYKLDVNGDIKVRDIDFYHSPKWTENTTIDVKKWYGITSSSDGTKLAAVVYGGNIWTSVDSGASWNPRGVANKNWYGITSSSDGKKLAATVNGEKIWTSDDYGASWTENTITNLNISWRGITSSSDGTKLAAFEFGGKIWTSINSPLSTRGLNWVVNNSTGSQHWNDITSSSDGKKLAACVSNGKIWTSDDYGVNWTERGDTNNWRGITSSSDGKKLAACVNSGKIWTSDDYGETWTENISTGVTKNWYGITSSSDGTKLAATVYGGNIWTSDDSGETWAENTSIGAAKNWYDITSSSDGTTLAATVYDGNIWTFNTEQAVSIYTSGLDYGNTKLNFKVSKNNSVTGNMILDSSGNMGIGTDWPTYKLDVNGDIKVRDIDFYHSPKWTENTSTGGTKMWYGITSSSDGTKLAAVVYGGNIWTSVDSGLSWTENISTGVTNKHWFSITSSSDGTKLAAVVYNGNIWTSDDSGQSWTARGATKYWQDITSSSDGTKLAAVVSNGNIWTSVDSGVTWTDRGVAGRDWQGITSSSDGTKLAATVYGGNIWTSVDSGVTWTENTSTSVTKKWYGVTSSSDGTKLAAVVYNGNIWTSVNSGLSWTENIIPTDNNWYGITSSSDGTKLAATVWLGNIWTSVDSGLSWTENTTTAKSWYGITSSSDGTKLAAIVRGGNIWTFNTEQAGSIYTSGLDDGNSKLNFAVFKNNSVTATMILDSSGNVGIGTDRPGYKLDVSGDIRFTGKIFNGDVEFTGGDISPWNSGGANIYYTNGGNVGIGTTSPSEKLTISINSTSVPALGLRNGQSSTVYNNGAQISFGYHGGNNYQHFIHTRHNSGNLNNAIDFYVCDGTLNNTIESGSIKTMSLVSGDVGIGTSSPDTKLHINSVDNNCEVRITAPDTHYAKLSVMGSGSRGTGDIYIGESSSYGGGMIYTGAADTISFYIRYSNSNTEVFRYSSNNSNVIFNGNVGIGVSPNGCKLDVAGTIKADAIQVGYGTNNVCYIGTAAISGSTPHGVAWASFSHYKFYSSSTDYSLMQNDAGATLLNCSSGQQINFRVANVSKMVLASNGNVGIGTTSPLYKLDVNGTMRVTGTITATHIRDLTHLHCTGNIRVGSTYSSSGGSFAGGHLNYQIGWQNYSGGTIGIAALKRTWVNKTRSAWYDSNTGNNWYVSIFTNGDILCDGAYRTFSDERIKKNIIELEDYESLNLLRKIEVKKYHYIDTDKGVGDVYGFIAQQVDSIKEGIVMKGSYFIPNIMKYYTAIIDTSNNEIIFEDLSGCTNVSNSIGPSGEIIIRFEVKTQNKDEYNQLDLRLKKVIQNKYYFELPPSYNFETEIFVYGIYVHDFHTLDKAKLFVIAFSATQEIDRIQQQEKAKLATAETKLATAEIKINTLESENTTLKSRLDAIEARLTSAGIN